MNDLTYDLDGSKQCSRLFRGNLKGQPPADHDGDARCGITLSHVSYVENDVTLLDDVILAVPNGCVTFVCGDTREASEALLLLLSSESARKNCTGHICGLQGKVAFLPKNVTLTTHLNIQEWFTYCGKLAGSAQEELDTVVDELDLHHVLDRPINTHSLSDTEIRRCIIGQYVLRRPQLLLLEDPTRGMDGQTSQSMARIFRNLAVNHNTAILCTLSNPYNGLLEYCDKLVIIQRGKLLYTGHFNKFNAFINKQLKQVSRFHAHIDSASLSTIFAYGDLFRQSYLQSDEFIQETMAVEAMSPGPSSRKLLKTSVHASSKEIRAISYKYDVIGYSRIGTVAVTILRYSVIGLVIGAIIHNLPSRIEPGQEQLSMLKEFRPSRLLPEGIREILYPDNILMEYLYADVRPPPKRKLSLDINRLAHISQCAFNKFGSTEEYGHLDSTGLTPVITSTVNSLAAVDSFLANTPWGVTWNYCNERSVRGARLLCMNCYGPVATKIEAGLECGGFPKMPEIPMLSCDTYSDEDTGINRNSLLENTYSKRETVEEPSRNFAHLLHKSFLTQTTGWASSPLLRGLKQIKRTIFECGHPGCLELTRIADNTRLLMTDVLTAAQVAGAIINVGGAYFLLCLVIGFLALEGLERHRAERTLNVCDIRYGLYSSVSFTIGRIRGDLNNLVIRVAPFTLMCLVLMKFNLGIQAAVSMFLTLFSLSFAVTGLAMMISTIFSSYEAISAASVLTLLVMALLGGCFIRESSMPSSMAALKFLSLFRWGYVGLLNIHFSEGSSYLGINHMLALSILGTPYLSPYIPIIVLLIYGSWFRVGYVLALQYHGSKLTRIAGLHK